MTGTPNLPDLSSIAALLSAIDALQPGAATVTEFDRADQVLRDAEAEVVTALSLGELPKPYEKDQLEATLEQVQLTISENETRRAAAKAQE